MSAGIRIDANEAESLIKALRLYIDIISETTDTPTDEKIEE